MAQSFVGGHLKKKEDTDVPPPAPAPHAERKADPASPRFTLKNPRGAWISLFNLGAFVAGISAGYFFRKMEEEFTRWGESLFARVFRGKGHGSGENREGRFHDHGDRHPERSHGDPLESGRRFDVEDEDRI